jgi:hypothetical protein
MERKRIMAKGKPRWKDLCFEDRVEKQLIHNGMSKKNAAKWKAHYKNYKNSNK